MHTEPSMPIRPNTTAHRRRLRACVSFLLLSALLAGGTGWLAGVSNDDRLRVHDEWTMFVQSRGGIEFNSLFSTSTGIPVRGRAVPIEADCRAVDSGVSGFFGQLRRET